MSTVHIKVYTHGCRLKSSYIISTIYVIACVHAHTEGKKDNNIKEWVKQVQNNEQNQ